MEWLLLLIPPALWLVYLAAKAAARQAQERRDALAALATARGWLFASEAPSDLKAWIGAFAPFQVGHSQSAFNTLGGHLRIDGRQVGCLAGDYTYKVTRHTGKTSTTTTHVFSWLIVACPFPGAPDLVIRRETFLDRMGAVIGLDDIDFESEEFSRAFYVKGPDRKFVFDVIHPRMIAFLMESSPPPIVLRDGHVCFGAVDGDVWSPDRFDQMIAFATAFLGLWPQYVLDDLESRHDG